jgi:PTH2 family peptidyl-tRNA hydrolase
VVKMDWKMYILVNKDIKIGKGKLAGQVGHAVASFMYNFALDHGVEELTDYMENDQKKIILKCPQEKLEELEKEGYISIRDKGYTQLEPDTLTCINFGIWSWREEDKPDWIKELKLL